MILITGGAGFIGSNIVAAFEARGEKVLVCDRLESDERWRNLAKRDLVDLIAPEDLFDALGAIAEELTAVIHMGAISATTETDVDKIVENNIRLTLDLVAWCTAHDVRLIYASSAATYGDGAMGFDDNESVEALSRLQPLNAYGWSKHFVDRRIARMKLDGDALPAQIAGLKFFNVYGPNEAHKGSMRSVVHAVYERAAAGQPARLFRSHNPEYADGGQLRDFVWVGDCVDMVMWLYDHAEVSGLFNCGTGQARSFLDLAKAVYAALDLEFKVEWVDTPEAIREKYQYFTEAQMGKIRGAGFIAEPTPLEDGVRRYVTQFLATSDAYR
ncbi:MAG: ADP-glyceromanno-heptose 6-epimerase [Planctomycetes bacterium]|jgi:ADP-L-glycero-D-manno-heptose 6-epimerase|nr:ADP-glyceromanno-heptose 6-epimerase [Planctomycetota bacterium]MBT4559225.1 ADP-glyceromanno-heptose 6-epimerase [Planctomycetota bacterium]MBT7012559.1 ADP-glyceromanno-heptose 6-epimerase [Planctomycetota bacterium]MBT7318499.1 ADP-glyceromanno-heptose 6-epimerase [Planctomycetota bacterium]